MTQSVPTVPFLATLAVSVCMKVSFLPSLQSGSSYVIVYQPSHQTGTGFDFNEAAVSSGIVRGAE